MIERYLFRGKRVDNGEWVYGYYVFHPKRKGSFGQTVTEYDSDRHLISSHRNGEIYEIDPSTVSSCTGLRDKNGKFIFEGDIVRFEDWKYRIFYNLRSGFMIERMSLPIHVCPLGEYLTELFFEIIGNVHDNPELLEWRR